MADASERCRARTSARRLWVAQMEAAARDGRNPSIRYHLGMACAKSGQVARGREILREALAEHPGAAEAPAARELLAGAK